LDFEILYLIFRQSHVWNPTFAHGTDFSRRQVLSCPAFSGAGATGRIAEEVVPAEDVDRNFQLVNGLVYVRENPNGNHGV
jgi:hypothetical protein